MRPPQFLDRLLEMVLSDGLVGFLDTTLLCLGLTWSAAAAVPRLQALLVTATAARRRR